MMPAKFLLVAALCWLMLASWPAVSYALTVQINGETIPSNVSDDDPTTVTLSEVDGSPHTYGCFKVEALDKTLPSPNNRARVRAIDSDTQDSLVFDNAHIKAVTGNCVSEVAAWHTFAQPPTTSGTSGIRFKRRIAAKALRGSNPAAGDEMWTTGWVPSTPIDEIGNTYYRKFPTNDGNFNNTQQEDCVDEAACSITANRDMKWWLKWNLKYATAPDRIELSELRVFTDTVVGAAPPVSLPPGAKQGPYESFQMDEVVSCCCGLTWPCGERPPLWVWILVVVLVLVLLTPWFLVRKAFSRRQ